jgi:hypothetical protein
MSIHHFFRFQGELILDMTHGYEVKGNHDRILAAFKQLSEFAKVKVSASAWIINAFPFRKGLTCSALYNKSIVIISVRHIPAWVPYISFKPLAQSGRTLCQEALYEPMRFVKESIVSNSPGTIVAILTGLRIICDRSVEQRALRSPSTIFRRLRNSVNQIAVMPSKG